MQNSFQLAPRYVIAFALVFINAIHFMALNFFEIPGNFAESMIGEHRTLLQVVTFGIAICTAIFYPTIVRTLSLKHTLIYSLSCDVLSLAFIWLSVQFDGSFPLILISTIFKGAAFLTVTIGAITYLVIEFPKKLGTSLMALFAFGDVGGIMANMLFNAFHGTQYSPTFFLLSFALLFSLIAFIAFKFFDPPLPKHLEHLRKETLIWKELHYRLAFFLIAGIAYGIIESVFAIWSEVYLLQYLPQRFATTTVSFYWFAMMIGKFVLLIPLYFFAPSRVFPLLIISTILSIIFIGHQTEMSGFLTGFSIAGLSLAAVMPMIIASMEGEIIASSELSHRRNYIPYVEIGTALIIGAHYVGVGMMTLYVQMSHNIASNLFFQIAILITAGIGLIIGFLNWSGRVLK